MGYIEELQRQAKATQEKWKKIDKLSSKLKKDLANKAGDDIVLRDTALLLISLVDQFKPAVSPDMIKSVKKMAERFGGIGKDGEILGPGGVPIPDKNPSDVSKTEKNAKQK